MLCVSCAFPVLQTRFKEKQQAGRSLPPTVAVPLLLRSLGIQNDGGATVPSSVYTYKRQTGSHFDVKFSARSMSNVSKTGHLPYKERAEREVQTGVDTYSR